MKVEVKKLDGIKRELHVKEEGELITQKFEQVYARLAKEAKVKGFRPGHVPRDILERSYASFIQEEVLKELLPEVYNRAVEQAGLEVLELPEISEVKLERSSLSFKAAVSIRPEVNLPDYRGIKVTYSKIEVTPDEIKRQLDAIKESRGLANLDDAVARGLGYPTLAELEAALEKQIYLQKENAQRQRIEEEVVAAISKDIEVELPPSLVARQLEELVKSAKINLAVKGLDKEEIEKYDAELRKQLEPEAKKQLKEYFILSAIAKKESIPETEHKLRNVIEFLLKEAQWQQVS